MTDFPKQHPSHTDQSPPGARPDDEHCPLDFDYLRDQVVGIDAPFETPFGSRSMLYGDYTASGRCLAFVESYLMHVQRNYANTHTEDDVSGRSMTQLLHEAEASIKRAVNAGPHGRLIAVGAGSTAAIDKFQQIVGVQIPPATLQLLREMIRNTHGEEGEDALTQLLAAQRPVIFVGAYEHHSNEVTWRQGLCEAVEVRLGPDGGLDLAHLEELLQDPRYANRKKIGSFSAASNVTGIRTPVREIARLLHAHGALACFDYAASAPYVEIDMNPDPGPEGGDPSMDAIFVSPHKFLGGPGSSGLLVFHERIYDKTLPPSVGGGGTVDYVGPHGQDFIDDIEQREKAGTPGVLQTMKAALAFEVKQRVGVERIEKREHKMLTRAFSRWLENSNIEILGNHDPRRRIGIVSFNLRDGRGSYLHPRLVTVLLNDLFGIQSRAGCSCAGPYGHTLLQIPDDVAQRYRQCVLDGYQGIKPGWCRIGFHYVMDEADCNYIIDAVDFLAREGRRFVQLYDFDPVSGMWTHKKGEFLDSHFSLDDALCTPYRGPSPLHVGLRQDLYRRWLNEAEELARELPDTQDAPRRLEGELGALQFFAI
jgi:selenocysteine lyase/cysteine desulfurase